MKQPSRWLEDEAAPPESIELLRVARAPVPLSDAARHRSRQRVLALAALPVAAALGVWPMLALGAALGVASSLVVYTVGELQPARPPAGGESGGPDATSEGRAKPPELVPPVSPPGPAPGPAVSAIARPEPDARSPSATPSSPVEEPLINPLDREIRLLERARRSLVSDPDGARLVLREHERSFPGGQLRIEREFLMVDALVRLGRRGEAEARAAALEVSAPKTLYGERLNRILGRDRR